MKWVQRVERSNCSRITVWTGRMAELDKVLRVEGKKTSPFMGQCRKNTSWRWKSKLTLNSTQWLFWIFRSRESHHMGFVRLSWNSRCSCFSIILRTFFHVGSNMSWVPIWSPFSSFSGAFDHWVEMWFCLLRCWEVFGINFWSSFPTHCDRTDCLHKRPWHTVSWLLLLSLSHKRIMRLRELQCVWGESYLTYPVIFTLIWTVAACGGYSQTHCLQTQKKAWKVITSTTGASSGLHRMTRCLSNGPRCISIRSIRRPAAAVKVASERHHGKARRTPGGEAGRGGFIIPPSRPSRTTSPRMRPHFRHLNWPTNRMRAAAL